MSANIETMRKLLLFIFAGTILLSGIACDSGSANNSVGDTQQAKDCKVGGDTPTEAYKRLFVAVKSKNSDTIKAEMSKKTQDFAVGLAQQQKNEVEKVYVNGFTGTTLADSLPEMRDERVAGCSGSVEVRNNKEQRWEDLPFVAEDGKWKFALGEVFADTFKSPGKSLDTREKEAANVNGGAVAPSNMPVNTNTGASNSKKAVIPKYNGPQVEPLPKNK